MKAPGHKLHTTNYFDTFIEVAEDCKAERAEIPPDRDEKTVARLHFDALYEHPYAFTSDEVLFDAYLRKQKIPGQLRQQERTAFFGKAQACLRASPLGKRYGWGIHFDREGRVAIYARESDAYQELSNDPALLHVRAMRSSRK